MRKIYVDWTGVLGAFQMNLPEIQCFLDLHEGLVYKLQPADERLPKFRTQPDRYHHIQSVPSRVQYQWLHAFIGAVEDPQLRGKMETAINGKGAFRRFKDILVSLPDERRRWFEHRDLQLREFIEQWVQQLGIEAENEPDWHAVEQAQQGTPVAIVQLLKAEIDTWSNQSDHTLSDEHALALAEHIGEKFLVHRRE